MFFSHLPRVHVQSTVENSAARRELGQDHQAGRVARWCAASFATAVFAAVALVLVAHVGLGEHVFQGPPVEAVPHGGGHKHVSHLIDFETER